MAALFEETTIKGIALKNRLVRSATHEGMGDEAGFPKPELLALHRRLSAGGVGLIITGYAYVSRDGLSPFIGMIGMDKDEQIPEYRKMVDIAHQDGTAIVMQIAHCGRQSLESMTGMPPIAPSPVRDPGSGVIPREMTEADIERVIEDFAKAALRVRESGFDGVQIHCAHGYLLSQFTCPHTNRRKDKWGGSTENRLRIVEEIYRHCRDRVGEDYPILIKYSSWDRMEDGMKPEEGIAIGQMLSEMGYDGIEVSCGIGADGGTVLLGGASPGDKPEQAYNREIAKALKQRIETPVFVVGGITKPETMEDIIRSGDADYISLCRALISDPAFPRKVAEGKREPARCVHCNLCIGYIATEPLRCYHGKTLRNKEPMSKPVLVLE